MLRLHQIIKEVPSETAEEADRVGKSSVKGAVMVKIFTKEP